jgi:hypothetical protein
MMAEFFGEFMPAAWTRRRADCSTTGCAGKQVKGYDSASAKATGEQLKSMATTV